MQNFLISLTFLKAACQNDRLWNVQLYDVIVWINSGSTEEDQHLLLHRSLLASPTDSHI